MSPDSEPAPDHSSAGVRLDSWKEIAAYLNRHVTTVRRWEKCEGLPVHRHLHDKLGSVYAFRSELDAWWQSRGVRLGHEAQDEWIEAGADDLRITAGVRSRSTGRHQRWILLGATALAFIAFLIYIAASDSTFRWNRHPIASLAVLPLENLSGDSSQDYLADAVTEALIGQLAQIHALRVVSRTSSMAVKGRGELLPEIGKALGVDAVVHGSVQRLGDRVRIAVRLIDARADAHLWARDYEREISEILTLQSEVARAVGQEIRIQITAEERARLASPRAVHPAAHQEYVIGRYHLWRDSDVHLQRAIAHFERATEFDPQFAAAYASLAHAWWKRGLWGDIGLTATEAPARAAAQKALQLDDALPEAYVVQADLVRLYDRDLGRAERLVRRALELQPHNVDAHYTCALVLMTVDRFDEAIAHMETAEQLDPLSPAIQSDFGRVFYRARRYDDAIRHLTRALKLEPAMGWLVHSRLAEVYEQMGEYDRALLALQEAGDRGGSARANRARVLARMGRREEARRLLGEAETDGRELGYETAAAYAALSDYDKAFGILFELIDRGEPGPNFVAVDPPFDTLHSDPRWPELVRRLSIQRHARTGAR